MYSDGPLRRLSLGVAMEGWLNAFPRKQRKRILKSVIATADAYLDGSSVGDLTEQERQEITYLRTLAVRLIADSRRS